MSLILETRLFTHPTKHDSDIAPWSWGCTQLNRYVVKLPQKWCVTTSFDVLPS